MTCKEDGLSNDDRHGWGIRVGGDANCRPGRRSDPVAAGRSPRRLGHDSRSQLSLDPVLEPSFPGEPTTGLPIGEPPGNLIGPHVQESTLRHLPVDPARPEPLDRNGVALGPPDLRDLERGIDLRPVDLRWRDVDFGGKIGIGIVVDIVGIMGGRCVAGFELGPMKVVALIGLDSAAPPLASTSSSPPGENRPRVPRRPLQ